MFLTLALLALLALPPCGAVRVLRPAGTGRPLNETVEVVEEYPGEWVEVRPGFGDHHVARGHVCPARWSAVSVSPGGGAPGAAQGLTRAPAKQGSLVMAEYFAEWVEVPGDSEEWLQDYGEEVGVWHGSGYKFLRGKLRQERCPRCVSCVVTW